MISDDEIRRAVSQRAFEAGLQYQMDGRVLDLRTAADGVTLEAEVKARRVRRIDRAFGLRATRAVNCSRPASVPVPSASTASM